jgi:hypothetical protein
MPGRPVKRWLTASEHRFLLRFNSRYRLHLSTCVATGLPISWRVEPANAYEGWQVELLLDEAKRRGAIADTAALDRGYDDASESG